MQIDGEDGACTEPPDPQCSRYNAGDSDGDEGTRAPFEEKQFDGDEDCRDGSGEGGGHTCGGSSDEKGGAFRIREFEPLGYERAEGATGHDDWAFRTEGATGADGDGCRQGLEHCDLGLHPRAAEQDRLDGFGDSVAANLVGAVVGHESDDEAADDGNEQH